MTGHLRNRSVHMNRQWVASRGARVAMIVVSLGGCMAGSLAWTDVASGQSLPRTSWGDPDIQGIWTNVSMQGVPLERPEKYAGRLFLTPGEIAEKKQEALKREKALATERLGAGQGTGAGPEHWYETGEVSTRTSLVVDPPDGRVPPLTEEARQKPFRASHRRDGQYDSWEDLSTWDRCLTRGIPGGMVPQVYGNNYQILQARGTVTILYEMIHDVRVIPLDGRPHIAGQIRQWLGDARGRWEGNTLVVETTNFTDKTSLMRDFPATRMNHSEALRLTERFTRIDAKTLNYRVTIDDPKTYTRPWTAEIPMTTDNAPDRILEYACHEGNYTVPNILSGARAQERAKN